MSIGENIKARRKALGMNQGELAQRLGITQANVSRMESSPRGPNADMLPAVAKALSCDVRDLLGMEHERDEAALGTLDDDARTFVTSVLASDPQLEIYMRSFVNNSDALTEEDWKFLASSLKLTLGYAVDRAKARQVRGSF